jgi:rare lipoprotein A (peptidoglycan hydrolase)
MNGTSEWSPEDDLHCSIGGTKPWTRQSEEKAVRDCGASILRSQSKATDRKEKRYFSIWLWVAILAIVGLSLIKGCEVANAQELTASYYSVQSLKEEGTYAYSGGRMANGLRFRDSGATCACNGYPLGTRLLVTNLRNGRSVVVLVTDRTARRFTGKRIDLAISQFAKIASLKQGIARVTVETL